MTPIPPLSTGPAWFSMMLIRETSDEAYAWALVAFAERSLHHGADSGRRTFGCPDGRS